MLKFIDLFAGIGGFHQALGAVDASCVFASEWDKSCQDTYEQNYGIRPHGDITQIDETDIPSHDILCAGFPCQAFSISGKQLGFDDTRGTLFFDVARIAKHHQPKVLILENVKNLVRHDGGRTLQVMIQALDEIGYITFYQILNASHFGVPQKRERVFLVAFRKDSHIDTFHFPTPNPLATKLTDHLQSDSFSDHLVIKRKDIYMKDIKISADSFGNYLQKPIRIGTVNKGGQGERIYSPLGHAITLSAYGGGVGAKTGLYKINSKIRRLTPRECARIAGFPDSFQLHSNKNTCYRQFGNTVVVPVVKAIVETIMQTSVFNALPYPQKPSIRRDLNIR